MHRLVFCHAVAQNVCFKLGISPSILFHGLFRKGKCFLMKQAMLNRKLAIIAAYLMLSSEIIL